ncbi:glycoside hydrolase family 38 N-terminal domain-containing protein [Henriciella marina]|uniref:glycoside hydrolase family 38 N-terminal domain-containing protein n=1 Tax=Henriciella marina TaxID=453851 RepID=UPI000375B9CF|nr:hypothetical protein [Henriciella marina]
MPSSAQSQTGDQASSVDIFDKSECQAASDPIWVVPNTHGTATGWLTGFASERNYMINNYISFLDSGDESGFPFSFSEVPTAIALESLAPNDFERFRSALAAEKASIANAFTVEFEPALVQAATALNMGRTARGWYGAALDEQPSNAWFIDVLGITPNMAELFDLVGIDSMVHIRNAETLDQLYILKAASGAETLVASIANYSKWRIAFRETGPLPEHWVDHLFLEIVPELVYQPDLPFLWGVGGHDYARKPDDPGRLLEIAQETTARTGRIACLGTLDDYWESVRSVDLANHDIETITTPSLFAYNAFWGNLPQLKQSFRSTESGLIATELGASVQSLSGRMDYPSQTIDDAWWLVLLNADRALQWGAGAGDVFTGTKDWNYIDRDILTREKTEEIQLAQGEDNAFDPVAWQRGEAYFWLDVSTQPDTAVCEPAMTEAALWCVGGLTPFATEPLSTSKAIQAEVEPFTGRVEADDLIVEFDERTGDILSIGFANHTSAVEGRLNELVWMVDHGVPAANLSLTDILSPPNRREIIGRTSEYEAELTQFDGPVFTTVKAVTSTAEGIEIERWVQIPKQGERIIFQTLTRGIPDGLLLVARHDLGGELAQSLRGTPFGFDRDLPRPPRKLEDVRASHDHKMLGLNNEIAPASLWSSHHTEDGSGIVLIDQGMPGREWVDGHIDHFLMNAQPNYRGKPNPLYSGMPVRRFSYAILPSDAETPARSARAAKSFNYWPFEAGQVEGGFAVSETLTIEAFSRQGDTARILAQNMADEEVSAEITVPWTHEGARIVGSERQADGTLAPAEVNGASKYSFKLAPRDAFELLLRTPQSVAEVPVRYSWEDLVPADKRDTLTLRDETLIGHPPE